MQSKTNKFAALVAAIMTLAASNAQAGVSTTKYSYNNDKVAGTSTNTVSIVDTSDVVKESVISYYDVVNRLDKIELPLMDGGLQTFDFGYDNDTDQLTSASYPNGGLQTFAYDDFDRLNNLGEFGFPDLVKFDYDHQDRVTAIIYGYNNGVACYQYDADGRLTKVGRILTGVDSTACESVDVEWTDYVYDAKGRLKTRTYDANGVQSYWDYALDTGQLREIGHTKNGTLIYSDTFIYVPGTNLYDKIGRTDATGLKTTDYDYDAHQRLTRVKEPDDRITAYKYDAFGNRTEKTITNINQTVERYRYDYQGNRLIDIYYTAELDVVPEQRQEHFSYDNVGRIKTRTLNPDEPSAETTTYSWDHRGYLIKLSKPGLNIDYTYNALGARTTKTVNGTLTKFVTAPVFGMNHVLMEADVNNNITRRYVYGGHQQLIQEPTPGNKNNDHFLLHGGSVGNITHAMNRTGDVVNQYDYDAFGSRTVVEGDDSTSFAYTGEQYDSETGLLYLRARYYDPEIGRFITVDPYLGRMEEPVTQNRYIYVQNNPLAFNDPTGMDVLNAGLDIRVPSWLTSGLTALGNKEIIPTGFSLSVAVSVPTPWAGGEFDLGLVGTGTFVTKSEGAIASGLASPGGRVTAHVGWERGGIRDLDGVGLEASIHAPGPTLGGAGASWSFDDNGVPSGASLNVGPGMNVGLNGTLTGTLTVRKGVDLAVDLWDETFGRNNESASECQ